jgi:hypothetical protein
MASDPRATGPRTVDYSGLIFAVTALAVVAPFLWLGIPSGHDFEFHMNSWMEVRQQWSQGVVYPRWAEAAHWGYGEARFIFYPPGSWMLGAALGEVMPWKLVPAAYIVVVLTLAGFSMFRLAREWLSRNDAVLAGALYAANPYFLVIVYWRSAFAELLAGALLPLLLLWILRLEERRWRAVVPLGLVVAAVWLINAPSAVMANYSLALLVVALAVWKRSPRFLIYGAVAAVIGIGLAAFYVLPAAYEEKWVNISQVLSAGVQPGDNFLFTRLADQDHNRFNRLVSLVAVGEMAWLALAALGARSRTRREKVFPVIAIWGGAAGVLMFSFTSLLWNHAPQLKFVQLPWRWLLCLNIALVLMVAMGWQRWWVRLLGYAAMLAVLAFVWHRVQPPWWDTAVEIGKMHDGVVAGPGYEGSDEYVPVGADPYDVDANARRATLAGPGTAHIRVMAWDAREKRFTAEVSEPSTLVVKLFNYPAWRVEVNGRVVETGTREDTGQMIVPVRAGENEVRVVFGRTWDRRMGGVVSGLTLAAILVGQFLKRERNA